MPLKPRRSYATKTAIRSEPAIPEGQHTPLQALRRRPAAQAAGSR